MYFRHFWNGRVIRSFPGRVMRFYIFRIYVLPPPSRSQSRPPEIVIYVNVTRSFPPGRDVLHLSALRGVDDGRIEQFLGTRLALHVVATDLAVLQGLVKGVRRRDIGGDAPETEVPARHHHDEEAEEEPEDVAGENVPPVVPVVAHSGHRTRNGPHAHQALQPRFQKQRPIRQTVLQVPLCAMRQKGFSFLQDEKKKTGLPYYMCLRPSFSRYLVALFYFRQYFYSAARKKTRGDRSPCT